MLNNFAFPLKIHHAKRGLLSLLMITVLGACSSSPEKKNATLSTKHSPYTGGGYYENDGPGIKTPPDFANVADAFPRDEPILRSTTRPYTVLGRRYIPMKTRRPFRESGIASWYGRQFHGKKTASGEKYNMYAMTAAHPTLPLPSYVRVTNRDNGRSVVVRVNDRGPFLRGRVIDMSYAAAAKLGFVRDGKVPVDIRLLLPGKNTDPEAAAQSRLGQGTGAAVYQVQFGVFSKAENARKLKIRLQRDLKNVLDPGALSIEKKAGKYWTVYAGPYKRRAKAQRLRRMAANVKVSSLVVGP